MFGLMVVVFSDVMVSHHGSNGGVYSGEGGGAGDGVGGSDSDCVVDGMGGTNDDTQYSFMRLHISSMSV